MHTQPDIHTKAKKDSLNDENIQEGGSDNKHDEPIEETQDINHLLKQSQPLFNEDNPVQYNERKRKLMGDDIHDSFLHPTFVKTSKISFYFFFAFPKIKKLLYLHLLVILQYYSLLVFYTFDAVKTKGS